jgi:TRAP-type mannitol/chloroaromatic compound transport system permease small subunit
MRHLLPRNAAARTLEGVIDVMTLACGWWLIGLSVATCVEMAGRKLFGFSLQGVDEVGGYTYAIVGAIGFSYTLLTRGHTRVDYMVGRLPFRVRAWLNVAATLSLAAFAVFAAYRAGFVVAESVDLGARSQTPLATPLWIPQGAWLAAFVVFAVAAIAAAVDVVSLARRRDWAEINRRHGPQTMEEEVESEANIQLPNTAERTA